MPAYIRIGTPQAADGSTREFWYRSYERVWVPLSSQAATVQKVSLHLIAQS
ncbi:hypothetical protein GCM10022419_080610 [Nonomuraea rosea]|uniref:Uncharacterized protein n=1 Tax=Nonomuraea rosea TaxID=638574 RepID=A0ABP6YP36_9ACTN